MEKSLIIQSAIACIVCGWTLYYSFVSELVVMQWITIALVTIVLMPIIWYPIRVTDMGDRIVINQIIGKKVFPKDEYQIEEIANINLYSSIRIFDSAVWVYWGYFNNSKIGKYFGQHVTENVILLTHLKTGKKYLIDAPLTD